jgi:GMP synthase-like glutamine amidotransferase
MYLSQKCSPRIRAFMHTYNEPLGYLGQVFSENDVPVEYVRLWEGDPVSTGDATHLVFLGGPMGANDESEFPWLAEEKELIRRAVRMRMPVLGLCLGAQLMASAHGATVYRFVNETGWCTVHRAPDASKVLAGFRTASGPSRCITTHSIFRWVRDFNLPVTRCRTRGSGSDRRLRSSSIWR